MRQGLFCGGSGNPQVVSEPVDTASKRADPAKSRQLLTIGHTTPHELRGFGAVKTRSRGTGQGRSGTGIGLILALVVAVLWPVGMPGAAAQAPEVPAPDSDVIDLASYPAERWIVQLEDPPLAAYRGGVAGLPATAASATGFRRLSLASSESTAYLAHLAGQQDRFVAELASVARNARVERRYEVTLNGMAVTMSPEQAAAVREMPGVKAVTPDVPLELFMFSTPEQIGAPALWEQVGGQTNAGEGMRIAIIDSGVYVTRNPDGSYAGNPCFDDTGYTAPPGYPRGETQFTNDKVIVARSYFRPDDPPAPGNETAVQGPDGSPHGTHVAGIAACNAGTEVEFRGATVSLSGIAPRAYLMNYRTFYPTANGDDFASGNAFVAELVDAFDDAVRDGADVISNSWGSSYQNTLAWPDPMVQAAEAAVDAGVVVVFANGNAGPATATVGSAAVSPKVISVGAVTKDTTIAVGNVDVTAPVPVSDELTGIEVTPAQFGPEVTGTFGPALYVPVEQVASDGSSLGCSLEGDASPFSEGALAGRIALIERGTCELSVKVFNAQRGGAVAALIYNSEEGGDHLLTMAAGDHAEEVTIPSWFMRRSQGLAMRDFFAAHPADASVQFTYGPRPVREAGDVVGNFSSRGPTQDKILKPDLVAPGIDVLSAGYAEGEFPLPFTGFGTVSGTSMAAPHVAGAAALVLQRHPDWTPAQVRSALMTTAKEDLPLATAGTPVDVLDRGAGRIDLTKAVDPGLTLDLPSLSAGERAAGETVSFTIHARNVDSTDATWEVYAVTDEPGGLELSVDAPSITVAPDGEATIDVQATTAPTVAPGDYGGTIMLANAATGRRLHVPVWFRVIPTAVTADVLLVDDDGSSVDPRFPDYAGIYRDTLDALGVRYEYLDLGTNAFPEFNALFRYQAVLVFTGDNDSFDTSRLTSDDQDTLSEWLDSGGRLWATGQNLAEVSDRYDPPESPQLGRSRLYHGYLGLKYETGTVYSGPAPSPTADGVGPMAGMQLDLAPGGDGAGNQASIEASSPIPDTDTFAASNTMTAFFRQIGGDAPAGTAISFGRSSEPSLEEERVAYRYRSVSMGFGLEGVNTTLSTNRYQLAERTLDWLLDTITVEFEPTPVVTQGKATLSFKALSSVGAPLTGFRWDFGDGSAPVTTTEPMAEHQYTQPGEYVVRVEVTDGLGHRTVASQPVMVRT